MGKYGVPTIVGDQHLYYIYRKGSIMSVGGKYKEATALVTIEREGVLDAFVRTISRDDPVLDVRVKGS